MSDMPTGKAKYWYDKYQAEKASKEVAWTITNSEHDSILKAKDKEIAELLRLDDIAVNRNNELHDIITVLNTRIGTLEKQLEGKIHAERT